jgi:protein phosphatase
MLYNYVSLSNIGLKRNDNEDYVGILEVDGGLLAIVCDGLGGNKAGEIASRITTETIQEVFSQLENVDYLERLKIAITEANNRVVAKASGDSDLKGMATTVEVLYLNEDNAYWGHVGDSRIYSLKNSKMKQITKDHSLVQKLVDEGYLTLKEAENHPNKNIIMRALGDNESIEIDLSKQKLNPNDDTMFFLCTDGVTGILDDAEIEEFILNSDLKKLPAKLSQVIEARGAPDNYSFVLIVKK